RFRQRRFEQVHHRPCRLQAGSHHRPSHRALALSLNSSTRESRYLGTAATKAGDLVRASRFASHSCASDTMKTPSTTD
ncbi:unnamed protein product, partial [Mycena citricolor]